MRRHPIPVVVACIFRDNTVLLHRKNESHDEKGIQRNPELVGLWECPGGIIEGAESPEEALIREMHEELNIDIKIGNIVHVKTFCGKDRKPYLVLFYRCYIPTSVAEPQDCLFVHFETLRDMNPNAFLPGEKDIIYNIAKEWI